MVQTWNAKDFIITVGPYILDGFGESDTVSVSYVNERFTKKSGVDGKVTRSKNNASDLAEVTVKLMQNSKSRAKVESLVLLDALTSLGTFPISVINPKLGINYVGATSWLEKDPDDTIAQEVGEVEYMFAVEELKRAVAQIP